jgi:ubiquinone/menaquinone biosynthesis C-methylase UbiE
MIGRRMQNELRHFGRTSLASCALWEQDEEIKEKFFSEVHAALALKPGAVVADIGSGDDSRLALSVSSVVGADGRVVCVDIKQEVLDKLKKNLPLGTRNVEVHLGKPDDPMLPRSSFDAVLISNAYHEMAEHQTMLAHLREALKPSGRLVVIESILESRRQAARAEQVKHHELSPELVESELRAAGFQTISRVEPLGLRNDRSVRFLVSAQTTKAQSDPWVNLRVLEGKWEGEVKGKPGKGVASREYRFELEGRFMSARNKSVYEPKSPNTQSEVHDDFGMFSYDRALKKIVLRQFHKEGFVNEFTLDPVSADGKLLEFITVRIENIPPGWRAKEVYRMVSPDEWFETFSLAAPGKDFELYSEAHLKRVK